MQLCLHYFFLPSHGWHFYEQFSTGVVKEIHNADERMEWNVFTLTDTYLCLALVSASICSLKSFTISWCFFFRMWAVSSDSRCTSSSSLRNLVSSVSRLRLISSWGEIWDWGVHLIVICWGEYCDRNNSPDFRHHLRLPRGALTSGWLARWGRPFHVRSGINRE